jgi:catechol 2,3-dioxygenase-like lactoylglutathione lyase family enzyme
VKRLHVHIAVENLSQSVGFYSTLFGSRPSILKGDYAKWMLDDPRVNFAISQRDAVTPGLDHLGIQVESDGELRALSGQLKAAGETTLDQEDAACCYAKSNKSWVTDPNGVRWETFFTFGEATSYGEDEEPAAPVAAKPKACCAPKTSCC